MKQKDFNKFPKIKTKFKEKSNRIASVLFVDFNAIFRLNIHKLLHIIYDIYILNTILIT
jgi:hypothetical protein